MKYFKLEEFACPCCGEQQMDELFLQKIDQAREFADASFTINSGYRCEKRNKEVGSTSQNHTSGKAADISCTNGPKRLKIIKGLLQAGFKRIGINKTFIHADIMPDVESIWLY